MAPEMIPLDMLQTKWTFLVMIDMMASPKVHARRNIMLKSDESNQHPSPWLVSQPFWNKLCVSVAVFTNLQIFHFL
jgi:hypothetical protein